MEYRVALPNLLKVKSEKGVLLNIKGYFLHNREIHCPDVISSNATGGTGKT